MFRVRNKLSLYKRMLSLPFREKCFYLWVWFLMLIVDGLLRIFPFIVVQELVKRPIYHTTVLEKRKEFLIRNIPEIVNRVAKHHLYPMTCLRRALVSQSLLSSNGIITQLRFGVRKEQDHLLAHAWLEYNNRPLDDLAGDFEKF